MTSEEKLPHQAEIEAEGVAAFQNHATENACPYEAKKGNSAFRTWWFNGYFAAKHYFRWPHLFTLEELLSRTPTAVLVLLLVLVPSLCRADEAYDIAMARLRCALAILAVADENPTLENAAAGTPSAAAPEVVPARAAQPDPAADPGELQRALDANFSLIADHNRLSDELGRCLKQIDDLRAELAQAWETIKAQHWQVAELKVAGAHNEPVGPTEIAAETQAEAPLFTPPMKLILPAGTAPQRHRRLANVYTGEAKFDKGWCQNCATLKAAWGEGNEDIELVWLTDALEEEATYPAIRFQDNNGGWKMPCDRRGNYRIPRSLGELCDIIDAVNGKFERPAIEATGKSAAIQASAQIQQGIDQWAKFVGRGNPVRLSFSGNHIDTLSLLSQKYDMMDIVGTEGRIEIDVPQSTAVPTKDLAFNYQIVGTGMRFDADPFVIPDFKKYLEQPNQRAYGDGYGVIGIDDALLWWSIYSMCKDVVAILSPSVDMQLPPQISCTVTLVDDTFHLVFDKGHTIGIKATWLFSIRLQVQEVTVNTRNIHAEFSGSRWIRSRDFEVK